MAIFGFRFLEWWYSPAGGASRVRGSKGGQNSQPALRAPPPAQRGAKGALGSKKFEKGVCPIHGGAIENPTALPSGIVACYKCLRSTEEVEEAEEGALAKVWIPDLGSGERVEVGRLRRIMG